MKAIIVSIIVVIYFSMFMMSLNFVHTISEKIGEANAVAITK